MAAVMNPISDIEAEDKELIEQLAKLQDIYTQIRDLRGLLPSALLEPARKAVASPGTTTPRDLAQRISKNVKQGHEDFQVLKKAWHDEPMRKLLHEATTTDFEQGTDAWTVNYQSLLSAAKMSNPEQPGSGDVIDLESIDEAKVTVEKFAAGQPKLAIRPPSAGVQDLFPLNVEIARLKMKIMRENNLYTVATDTSDRLTKHVAEAVTNASRSMRKIESLLQLLEAYHDIRGRFCETCTSLVNQNLDLPVIRRREATSATDNPGPKWLAYHTTCAP